MAWQNGWSNEGTAYTPQPTIEDAMLRQAPTIDGWICPTCKNHEGGLGCKQNVFIAVVGANMSRCQFYDEGKECVHCGKAT